MDLFPLSNYTFGTKEAMFDKDSSISERFARLKKEYSQTGTRRSVEATFYNFFDFCVSQSQLSVFEERLAGHFDCA